MLAARNDSNRDCYASIEAKTGEMTFGERFGEAMETQHTTAINSPHSVNITVFPKIEGNNNKLQTLYNTCNEGI